MARMDFEDKIRGAMLGGALGDAIGELAFGLGDRAALTAAVDRRPSLVYTDDTAMAIGVAEVLVAHGGLDPETLGRRFHDNYRREPWRGYGPGPPTLFALVERDGLSYAAAARRLYGGEGSFGNGAAMRVAPVGLFVSAGPALEDLARASAEATHAHPVGIDGAVVQAAAVASAVDLDPAAPFDAGSFCRRVADIARISEMRARLASVERLWAEGVRPARAAAEFGFGIAVQDSLPFALYSFLTHPDSLEDCLFCATLHAGDRDTVGAMACAVSGAYLGVDTIPAEWLAKLENRDLLDALARRLAAAGERRAAGLNG